jgi:ABC transport system ATP-binding/permease protein
MQLERIKDITRLFALIGKLSPDYLDGKDKFIQFFLSRRLSYQQIAPVLDSYLEEFELEQHQNSVISRFEDLVRLLKLNQEPRQSFVILLSLLEYLFYDKGYSQEQLDLALRAGQILGISDNIVEKVKFILALEEMPSEKMVDLIPMVNDEIRSFMYSNLSTAKNDRLAVFYYLPEMHFFLFKNIDYNNLRINNEVPVKNRLYLFAQGATLKFENGKQFYFSELMAMVERFESEKIIFEATNLSFKIAQDNAINIENLCLKENEGRLVGILGASGAGKTTLINLLSGLQKPDDGKVTINGVDIYKDQKSTNGIIGYVGQDDILIDNLTVFQNLYFNARLCFKNRKKEVVKRLVFRMLRNLDLHHVANVQVGTVLSKTISGGQRKRLMIAMELIREPLILFLDEPTSGLSSQDSKNVLRLLKELSVKGKLLFCVIHQPSSELFHSFDRILVLDQGGVLSYYGMPTDCLNHFKKAAKEYQSLSPQQLSSTDPDIILETIESKVQDDFGGETIQRKLKPQDWKKRFLDQVILPKTYHYDMAPKSFLETPNKLDQWWIFLTRDVLSKVKSSSYLLLMLLEAPILGLLIALLLRHKNNADNSQYVYAYNDNIPAFLLVSVIFALFIGLSSSVQEINKDQSIRKRERFLNLSRKSYLLSKVAILFFFSAVQMLLYVLVSNYILKIEGMVLDYWLILFSAACVANLLGLCVSDTFDKLVSAYILIPLLLIPQMVLSGGIFDFDKINQAISRIGRTPIIADVMVSRWAFEALSVNQDADNQYSKYFYQIEKNISKVGYYKNYWLPEMHVINTQTRNKILTNSEIQQFHVAFPTCKNCTNLEEIKLFLFEQNLIYTRAKDNLLLQLSLLGLNTQTLRENYYNEKLHYFVRHLDAEYRIMHMNNTLFQNYDNIYLEPSLANALDWRAPMFVNHKNLLGYKVSTFWFNLIVIWLNVLLLYIVLYYQLLGKVLWLAKFVKSKIKRNEVEVN